ncbi:hypothetical protein LTR27_008818 [Elasticomyces elasticus]|nr:hypothetical protein LTR27_008818 [Elasticomyces elasticus]
MPVIAALIPHESRLSMRPSVELEMDADDSSRRRSFCREVKREVIDRNVSREPRWVHLRPTDEERKHPCGGADSSDEQYSVLNSVPFDPVEGWRVPRGSSVAPLSSNASRSTRSATTDPYPADITFVGGGSDVRVQRDSHAFENLFDQPFFMPPRTRGSDSTLDGHVFSGSYGEWAQQHAERTRREVQSREMQVRADERPKSPEKPKAHAERVEAVPKMRTTMKSRTIPPPSPSPFRSAANERSRPEHVLDHDEWEMIDNDQSDDESDWVLDGEGMAVPETMTLE